MSELQFGVTPPTTCSYLPSEQEQLIVLLPEEKINAALYQQLLALNFRRSAEHVYTPYCQSCRLCQSIRINPTLFKASSSQKRLLNKIARHHWRYELTHTPSTDYYPLFEQYIRYKHADGSMFPPSPSQLSSLTDCSWLKVKYLEQFYNDELVSVTVVDETDNALSAVYTFYHQNISVFSPGTLSVLFLLQCCMSERKDWLYLGYYIESCQKMAYKAAFLPQERFIQGQWHSFG